MGAERRDEALTLSKYGSVRQAGPPSTRFTPVPSTTPPTPADCEAIRLPENLESIPRAEHFPTQRHRWNTNEEIAALLISFAKHTDWLSKEVKIRPKSGSMLLYSRKKVRYRRDGYCWKKRKDGKTTREDHMKLKVQGIECIYGCYVHSAILPTFHRRCYWLLQNPDIVLVHYLNVPYPDDNKLVMASSISLWADKKEWTKEELISQLKPMFFSEEEPDTNNELEISTAETVEAIVGQLMEKQRAARVAASKGLVECGCATGVAGDHAKQCNLHPLRRITIAKLPQQEPQPNHHSHTTHRHHHHHQSQPVVQHHNNGHQRPQNPLESPSTVTSSRQTFVALPSSSDTDSNQVSVLTSTYRVSSTSGGAPGYQGMNQEGSRRPQPSLTPSPSSPPSPSNNINNNKNGNKSNSNIENTSKNHNLINNNNNSNTTSTPLILNLSNIQGGGGLLIFNSSSSQHSAGGHHGTHSITTPFTLTSYFSPANTITTSGSLHSTTQNNRIAPPQVIPQNQENLHLSTHLNQHHLQIQPQQHIHQERLNSSVTPVLIKREAKDDMMESLKLDVVNGNLTLDSGTFANLVSSLEASEARTKKPSRTEELKESLLSIKSEHLTDLGKEELFANSLELSTEDIQKTLSANLPGASNHNKSPKSTDDNPMDFIENNMSSAEDDVLANLDAFDMLSDFPDLDHYDTSPPDHLNSNSSASCSTNVSGKSVANQSQQTLRVDYRENSTNITDYSPEWAYPEGGVKVLVTGPFYSSSSPYTVLFDGVPTSTNLVQAGVLRCYCPAHDVGLVTLQVACEGFIVSNSVIFEYKKPPLDSQQVKEEDILQEQDEHLLKFTLLQRLETLESHVHPQNDTGEQETQSNHENDILKYRIPNFQDHVVTYCQNMSKRHWLPTSHNLHPSKPSKKPTSSHTILHIAARLGYSRLIVCFLRWKNENGSLALELEVDALRKDQSGRTPLSWACIEGHRDAALILCRWNPQAINYQDNHGVTPLSHAKVNGHRSLEEEIRKLEEEIAAEAAPFDSSPPVPLTLSGSSRLRKLSSPSTSSPSLNVLDTSKLTVTSDGFLRPSPRRFDMRKQRQLSVDFHLGMESDSVKGNEGASPGFSLVEGSRKGRIVKRPSVDSVINLISLEKSKRASLDSGLDVIQKHSRNAPTYSGNRNLEDYLLSPTLLDIARITGDEEKPSGDPPQEEENSQKTSENDSSFSLRGSSTGEMSSSDNTRVFTLAEQIIAAIPERIKGDEEDVTELLSPCSTEPPSSDLIMEGYLDEVPDSNSEFNFELSDIMSYRYMEVNTPSSSLSPASSSCLPSPASFPIDSPSPPPTTADFSEFFHASTKDFSTDFSNLTLSDQEQRELYEAAKMIQKAYRLYQGRKKLQAEQDRESQAAILIQNYYRRYKQYAYFRQMSRAATLIQTQFRSYCESKRFKKNQKEAKFSIRSSREGTPVPNLKRSYSQRRQHQAARKIQQFMRQTKQNIWDLLTDNKPIAERTGCSGGRKRETTPLGGSSFRACVGAASVSVHTCTSVCKTNGPNLSSKSSSSLGAGGPLIGALPQCHRPFAFAHSPTSSPT